MYCPYCHFRIDSYHQTVCPNCHHSLPDNITSQMRTQAAQSPSPSGSGMPKLTPATTIPPDYKQTVKVKRRRRRRKPSKLMIIALIVFLYYFPLTQPYVKPHVDSGIDAAVDLWEDATSPYILIPEKTSFVLERDIYITAESGTGHFDVHYPDIPSTPYELETSWGKTIQNIKNFDITIPEGNNFVNETRNGTWLSFEGDLSEGQEVHIRLTYTVEANAIRWDERLDRSESGTVADIPQSLKDQYNHDEHFSKGGSKVDFIEVEKYRDLAKNVTKGESTVYGQIKAIYDYVLDNVQYVRGRDPKSCTLTLDKGHGDCDDMSAVFVSLARGLGIPCWLNFGQLSDEKFTGWGGHSWVEVYIPTKDGGHYNAQIDLANNLFLIYSPTRLLEWRDSGNEDDLIYFYYYFSRSGADIDIEQELTTKDYSTSGQIKINVDW